MTNVRLPDPLSQPGAPGFSEVRLIDNLPTYRDRLPGGKVITSGGAAQYWGFSLKYEDLLPDEFEQLMGTVRRAKQSGANLDIMLPHKTHFRVQGVLDSTVVAKGQKGADIVITNYNTTGDSAPIKGLPKVGDIFQLTRHCSKVYTITEVNLEGNKLTLGIYPNLMKETTGEEKPKFDGILFQVVLSNPSAFDNTVNSEGIISAFNIDLEENVTYAK